MDELYNKIKDFTTESAIEIESNDRQYIALKKLYDNFKYNELFLPFIVSNSIVCYQLSGTGEDYWEEFSKEVLNSNIEFKNLNSVMLFFIDFLPKSLANRRLVEVKINRLRKLHSFLEELYHKQKFYYKNMLKMRNDIAKVMNQSTEAKTVNFAVKMFGYGARIRFEQLIEFPNEIMVPIDSRLTKLFKKFSGDGSDINTFYADLAKNLNMPPLHLDSLLWTNYDNLMNDKEIL